MCNQRFFLKKLYPPVISPSTSANVIEEMLLLLYCVTPINIIPLYFSYNHLSLRNLNNILNIYDILLKN